MKNAITNPVLIAELQEIAKENNGILLPKDVVERAKDQNSALHSWFKWDDEEAAEQWRLQQARQLIREVYVKIKLPDGKMVSEQVFVSLKNDRVDGGYRA